MKNKSIAEMLSHLTTLTNSWDSLSRIPAIERDIALEELRTLYETIQEINLDKTLSTASVDEVATIEEKANITTEPIVEQTTTEEVHNSIIDSFDDALDIDALLGLSPVNEEPIPEPAVETKPEIATEEEVVAEHEIATEEESIENTNSECEVTAESSPAPVIESLFGIEDIPVRSKSSRRMISLYNTPTTSEHSEPTPAKSPIRSSAKSLQATPIDEPKPTPIEEVEAILGHTPKRDDYAPKSVVDPTPEPVAIPATAIVDETVAQPSVTTINDATTTRLGDILGNKVTVLGDKLAAEEQPTTPFNRISDLRKAIGINDKFLMVRDLFDGNNDRYEATIETLNEFDDLDECMIYIVENFAWNPDSEGAKLLISLLERKLS